nr:probable inactive serine/threonine-protein kinase gdt6 [Misgurnus anguillicaudatus]
MTLILYLVEKTATEKSGTTTTPKTETTTTPKTETTTTPKTETTTTKKQETSTAGKSDDIKIVIPSVLVIIALLVTTLTVWLIYRRRAHKRASVVNQNNISTEQNGEDVTYIELKHNTVKQSKVDTVTEDQETVYSGVKLA